MVFGYSFCLADTEYTVGPKNSNNFDAGRTLSTTPNQLTSYPLTVTVESTVSLLNEQPTAIDFPDGSKSDEFGTASIPFRYDDTNKTTRIKLEVNKTINNLRIYYQAPHSDKGSKRVLQIDDGNSVNAITPVEYEQEGYLYPKKEGCTDFLCIATIDNLPIGTYYIYCISFTGGLIGMKYNVIDYIDHPNNDPGTDLIPVTKATTWSFSGVSYSKRTTWWSTTTDFEFTGSGYSSSPYYPYQYLLYKESNLDYKTTFEGDKIAFCKNASNSKQYPSSKSQYTQGGTLVIKPGVPGAIKVTFSYVNSDIPCYLSVNGDQTSYSANKKEGSDYITTELIPVNAGDVYITGMDEKGNDADIRVTEIQFVPFGKKETEGVSDDLFTQRIFSHNDSRKSESKWVYCGYKNGTHGLLGGVEDNGIIYVSSPYGETSDNNNGNIKFSIDNNASHAYTHFLSCQKGSTIYIPVPQGSSGILAIEFTGSELGKTVTVNNVKYDIPRRRFILNKANGKTAELDMNEKGSSVTFNDNDLVQYNNNGLFYLKLDGFYDLEFAKTASSLPSTDDYKSIRSGANVELKVLSFTVTLDNNEYTFTLPEEDYDHQILGNHRHAIFNYTEGDIVNSSDHKSGSMTLQNGAKMTGVDHEDKENSTTNVFHSYRDGDLVKYKTQYYGAIQMLSHTDYTITAPAGYYITTSVRIHGYNNKDTKAEKQLETYVEYFNEGVYYDDFKNLSYEPEKKDKYEMEGLHDHTYLESLRDEEDAETTTLDFTTTATESLTFSFDGYQFLGVVDAVLVRKIEVPTLERRLTYDLDKIHVDLNNYEKLGINGTINYTPRENEELWWYFIPDAENTERDDYGTYGHRGCITREIKGKTNSDDPNVTKTFSVRNFKFVNTAGSHETNESLKEIYNNEGNFKKAQYLSSPDAINTLADATDGDGKVSLKITQGGKYYFYIRDTKTNLNSVLAVKTFDVSTGVEDITVEDNYETDDLYAPVYNIYGQRVDSSYRGIVIRNGRKYVQK